MANRLEVTEDAESGEVLFVLPTPTFQLDPAPLHFAVSLKEARRLRAELDYSIRILEGGANGKRHPGNG